MSTVFTCDEDASPRYQFTVKDHDGNAIQPDSITLTFYDRKTNAIINSRDAQDVLNLNNVAITNGALIWDLQPADTAIVNTSDEAEVHKGLWEYVFDTDKNGKHETFININNLNRVP